MNKTATVKSPELPKGILKSDLKSPSWKSKNKLVYEGNHRGVLTLHYVTNRGWVIATLPISAARAGSGFEARTYAIEVAKKPYSSDEHNIVTVGKGPHITHTVSVYITTKRQKALQPFIDIFNKGLVSAGTIRDRISTRRASTVLRRSGGLGGFAW
jgi:hypothetical protein